jgi:hypothetical protein
MSGHLDEFDSPARKRLADMVRRAMMLVVSVNESSRCYIAATREVSGAAALNDCRLLYDKYTVSYIHSIASTLFAIKEGHPCEWPSSF